MIQEDKSLLCKDLLARLQCGVKCYPVITNDEPNTIGGYCEILDDFYIREVGGWFPISMIKPYLRPMSSMTKEERIEFSKLLHKRYCEEDWKGHISTSYCIEIDNVYTDDENCIKYPSAFSMDAIDWLNANHFDYRDLIPKDLAFQAPEGMYK